MAPAAEHNGIYWQSRFEVLSFVHAQHTASSLNQKEFIRDPNNR